MVVSLYKARWANRRKKKRSSQLATLKSYMVQLVIAADQAARMRAISLNALPMIC